MYDIEGHYCLIVTDLDGTLLDHHSYDYTPAKPMLEHLETQGIPVIINSSKTAREIEQLRLTMGNRHPFIVENGSGLLLPTGYFKNNSAPATEDKGYEEITLGKPRTELIDKLQQLPPNFAPLYRAYHSSTIADIVEMTGLSPTEATHSRDRQYTEPLQWLGTQAEKEQFFFCLQEHRVHYTEGGRFIHLMGQTNKGSATEWLAQRYQKNLINQSQGISNTTASQAPHRQVKVIALGDGENDIDLLKAADIAVVIRSPAHSPPVFDHPCKLISDAMGPRGWADSIATILANTSLAI